MEQYYSHMLAFQIIFQLMLILIVVMGFVKMKKILSRAQLTVKKSLLLPSKNWKEVGIGVIKTKRNQALLTIGFTKKLAEAPAGISLE